MISQFPNPLNYYQAPDWSWLSCITFNFYNRRPTQTSNKEKVRNL